MALGGHRNIVPGKIVPVVGFCLIQGIHGLQRIIIINICIHYGLGFFLFINSHFCFLTIRGDNKDKKININK